MAAISEKDAHIALLENSNSRGEEIQLLRKHKDKLMKKLKEEVKLFGEESHKKLLS